MFEVIQQSETTAARRRIYFDLIDSSDHLSPKDITVTGVKVKLSKNAATAASSTNDIVKLDATNLPGCYYLELTAAEADTVGQITGYLAPTGCDPCTLQGAVVAYDPYADGAEATSVADALLARNQQGGSDSAPTVSDALAGGLLKFSINAGTGVITVQHGDDTTAFTRTLSRDATGLLYAILGAS